MDGQLSFATLDYAGKKKRTKRDVFLAEMAATVPWSMRTGMWSSTGRKTPLESQSSRRFNLTFRFNLTLPFGTRLASPACCTL